MNSKGEDYIISGFTVLKPSRKNKSFLGWFKERAKIYSLWELFIVGITFFFVKVITMVNKENSPYSNSMIFSKNKIKHYMTNNINEPNYIREIADLNPDIILSISSPQLFGEELLATPKLFCLNAHGTLLPRHRGVFGSFWTLFDNDTLAGGTIHTMELKLDVGEILWQESFDVKQKDTQYTIAYKTKKTMAYGLVSIFKKISLGQKLKSIHPLYKTSYHRAPTKEQGVNFRKKDKRIVELSNIRLMLAKSF